MFLIVNKIQLPLALVLLVAVNFAIASPADGLQELQGADVDLEALGRKLNPEGIRAKCASNDSAGPIGGLSGNPEESSRWSNGYNVQLDKAWSKDQANMILGALKRLRSKFCIPIKQIPTGGRPSGDYVFIQKGGKDSGCYSDEIGRRGGRQLINLENPGCMDVGTIMHENLHALGFNHEQTRPDRDDNVIIHEDAIEDGKGNNFEIYSNSLTFDVPYDYDSIMHYNSMDFSNGNGPTITKLDGSLIDDPRQDLTTNDQSKLQRMYNC